MQFKFHIGTKIIFGVNCIKENKSELSKYGKRAIIVTGKSSGKTSGALDDIANIFKELKIDYMIYDKIENNPSLESVEEAGKAASSFEADFVVGLGGGSPLDASKAVAVLAVNDIDAIDLYKNTFINKPLPILTIPTTAGTGSEITPYSILTRRDIETKMSFGNEDTVPKVAFLDARYTESMSYSVTVDTAVDALSHAVEGYVSKRSTKISDMIALEAINIFGKCIEGLRSGIIDFDLREKLLYMAMLAGMVISHTGTTIVHGMGYSLTYFKDIPHGRANGMLMKEYFKFIEQCAKQKIDNILQNLNMKSIDEFGQVMDNLLQNEEVFNEQELKMYASLAMKQKSAAYNLRNVTEEDLFEIMRKSLVRS